MYNHAVRFFIIHHYFSDKKVHMPRFRRISHILGRALLLSSLLWVCSTAFLQQQPVALAHAFVIDSDPVDGSTINQVPKIIRVFFNANISPLSIAHVFNTQNGQFVEIQTTRSVVSSNNPRELDTILLNPTTLTQGGYFMRWTAVADADGHTTFGAIGFNVGYSSTGLSGTPTLGPSSSNALDQIRQFDFLNILAVAWEWLSLLALIFWLGILLTERLILVRMEPDTSLLEHTARRVFPLHMLCLWALLMGNVVTLLLRILHLSDILTGGTIDLSQLGPILVQSTYGRLWLVRMVLILATLGLLRFQRSKAPLEPQRTFNERGEGERETTNTVSSSLTPQRATPLWLLLAALIVLTTVLSSEAGQITSLYISTVILNWLYIVAQGFWFGGLAYLGYILLPIVQRDGAATLADFLRRFSPWLLASIGVSFVSALFLAESTLSSMGQLLNEPYGRIVLITSILLLLLVLTSLYGIFVARPKLTRQAMLLPVVDIELPARRARQLELGQTRRMLRQVVNAQSLLAVAVLLCAALLSFYAPPIVFPQVSYSNPASAPTIGTTQSKTVDNLAVTVQVLPGRIGYTNTLIITILDANTKPITDAQLRLNVNMTVMNMDVAHANIKGGNPTYIVSFGSGAAFSMEGTWQISLTIQRPKQAEVQASFIINITA